MRLWLLIVLAAMPIFGFNYNPLLLKAQASIFPKLLMLAKEPEKLLVNENIVFAVIHEEEDFESAWQLKNMMEEQYGGYLEGFPFRIVLIEYEKLNDTLEASAVIALHSEAFIHKLAQLVIKKKIVSFVGDAANLKEGFLFSLNLERSTVIYMNKPMLPYYGIEFSDTLYHVVRFFDEN
jgi:hypothetical protein